MRAIYDTFRTYWIATTSKAVVTYKFIRMGFTDGLILDRNRSRWYWIGWPQILVSIMNWCLIIVASCSSVVIIRVWLGLVLLPTCYLIIKLKRDISSYFARDINRSISLGVRISEMCSLSFVWSLKLYSAENFYKFGCTFWVKHSGRSANFTNNSLIT